MKKEKLTMLSLVVIGVIIASFVTLEIKNGFDVKYAEASSTGNILFVGGMGLNNYTSTQDAIDNTSDGDTVYVFNGTYYENVVINKSINLVGEDKSNTIIDGNSTGDVIHVIADWVNISGFTIRNGGSNWGDAGIDLRSNHNTVSDNIVTLNKYDGIYFNSSSNNTIKGNTISLNNGNGIELWFSCNNTIIGNNISSNIFYGILLVSSFNNSIIGNQISPNNYYGVYLSSSSNNIFYHNNFINNSNQAYDSSSNIWDNGYPSGGNHWSDFDEPSEGAWDNNSDGIVDLPYNISGGSNQDLCPLVEPWNYTPPSNDTIPPTTTIHIGEPKYGDYVTPDTEITLTATDTLTGVNKTYYRVWYNGNWDPEPGTGEGIDNNFYVYTEGFALDGECVHYVEFYSMDNASNNETVHNQTHSVDETPPSTTHSLDPPSPNGLNGWYNTSLFVILDSTDDKSGVDAIFYTYINGGYHTYTEPLTPPDGHHTLYYYSIDNLGNTETPFKEVSFKVDTTPPTVSIVSGPSGTVSTTTVTFEWSGSDHIGGVKYRYKLDGTWSGWTSDTSHEFTGLSEGDYTFYVKARDGSGNTDTEERSFSISVNEKPIADAGGPYTGAVGIAITFDGSGSYDPDGGIASYSWNFGDGHTGTGVKPPHAYSGQGIFYVTLTVTDNLGATDTDATTAMASPNQLPTVATTSPSDGATVSGTVNIQGTADDTDGTIEKVEVRIDSGSWQIVSGTTSWSYIWDTTGVGDGSHMIYARSFDGTDYSNVESMTVTVDNIPPNQQPTVSISSPANGDTISGTITIQGTADDTDGTVESVEIKINSVSWNTASGTTSWSYSWDTTGFDNGNYTIQTRSYDGEDYSDIVSVSVIVFNNHKPTVNMGYPLNGTEINGTVSIQGTASDADGNETLEKVEIKIGDEDWTVVDGIASWNFSWDTTSVDNGDYIIQARSYDGHEYSSIDSIMLEVKNKEKDDGIPGFEMLVLIIAVGLIALWKKKKQ